MLFVFSSPSYTVLAMVRPHAKCCAVFDLLSRRSRRPASATQSSNIPRGHSPLRQCTANRCRLILATLQLLLITYARRTAFRILEVKSSLKSFAHVGSSKTLILPKLPRGSRHFVRYSLYSTSFNQDVARSSAASALRNLPTSAPTAPSVCA